MKIIFRCGIYWSYKWDFGSLPLKRLNADLYNIRQMLEKILNIYVARVSVNKSTIMSNLYQIENKIHILEDIYILLTYYFVNS
jgi:hypothetical protein